MTINEIRKAVAFAETSVHPDHYGVYVVKFLAEIAVELRIIRHVLVSQAPLPDEDYAEAAIKRDEKDKCENH